ncbi:hypothetical protein P5V15_000708 [Pogonomyrmex californicus]
MDSLANYASDGDNSNNSDDAKTPTRAQEEANRRASDANYDPVQMDMIVKYETFGQCLRRHHSDFTGAVCTCKVLGLIYKGDNIRFCKVMSRRVDWLILFNE